MHAVKAENLVKKFGDFIAVDNISFEIEEGEIFGFLGPNGAGKTTTIRMLCCIILPTSGNATIHGYDLIKKADEIKEIIGYMSQKFSLYSDLTVIQNLKFYSGIYRIPKKLIKERIEHSLEIANLHGLEKRLVKELAGGVKQRLALATAILHKPKILFLDEPTAGVDPSNRREFWKLIKSLSSEGITIFVTTHYMDEAEQCDRLMFIYSGRKIAEASPYELITKFIDGVLFEVSGLPPEIVVKKLKDNQHIKRVQVFGLVNHILMNKVDNALEILNNELFRAGFNNFKVKQIRPSLEDSFINMIELEDKKIETTGIRMR